MIKEPKRLSEMSDELGASLGALRAQTPSDDRLAALAARLTLAGAPVDEPASGVVRRPATSPKLRLVSGSSLFDAGTLAVILALLVGGGLIAAAVLIRAADVPLAPAPEHVVAAPVAAAPAVPVPIVPPEPTAETSAPADSRAAARTTRDPAHGPERDEGTPSASGTPPASGATELSLAPSPTVEEPLRPTSSAGARETSRRAPSVSKATSGVGSEGAPLAENTVVDSEIELLKKAKSALGVDPLQAYALTERCRALYAAGSFGQEREYIAISALSRLGQSGEARSRAALFRMHYPNSAYLPRLAPMLGEE